MTGHGKTFIILAVLCFITPSLCAAGAVSLPLPPSSEELLAAEKEAEITDKMLLEQDRLQKEAALMRAERQETRRMQQSGVESEMQRIFEDSAAVDEIFALSLRIIADREANEKSPAEPRENSFEEGGISNAKLARYDAIIKIIEKRDILNAGLKDTELEMLEIYRDEKKVDSLFAESLAKIEAEKAAAKVREAEIKAYALSEKKRKSDENIAAFVRDLPKIGLVCLDIGLGCWAMAQHYFTGREYVLYEQLKNEYSIPKVAVELSDPASQFSINLKKQKEKADGYNALFITAASATGAAMLYTILDALIFHAVIPAAASADYDLKTQTVSLFINGRF